MTMQDYSNGFRVRHVTMARLGAPAGMDWGALPVWILRRCGCTDDHNASRSAPGESRTTSPYAGKTVDVIDTIGCMTDTTARLTISAASPSPTVPEAYGVLRAYMAEIASRYWGSAATSDEVDEVLLEDPSDDLVPPTGVFLLARDGSGPVGCVAVRRLNDDDCELKRMYVDPAARGRGIGRELVAAAERAALEFGATTLKLDTRSDLVEARTLYVSCGFVEIPAYNAAW